MSPLPPEFYARSTVAVAKDLLGHRLVSLVGGRRCAVRLVEVEAYVGPGDPASHAYRWRRSRRNAAMYGPPGTLYVFFTYGMHWCANVVTEREGLPAAVLLRAGEPLEGIATMRRRRRGATEADLASGPAKLAQALGITGGLDGHALAAPPVWIEAGEPVPARRRAALPRVGVRRGARRCLRFAVRDCPHVSRPRP